MKKKFMKKAFAVVLSTAMTFSLSSTVQLQTASAAKKFVSLNTSFKTLKVGQTYKLRLVNNTSNWTIKKVATTNKTIATVYGKKSSSVMIKGKGTGRATIRVSLKTAAKKTNNTKTLRCRVNVKGTAGTTVTPSPEPTPSKDPVQTSAEVTTQTELNEALANNAVTSITINTSNTASLTIPSGKYNNIDLTVNAPSADIVNNGVFKSVTIKAIKGDTWTENAQGNKIVVDAAKARIIVNESANVAALTITKTNADVALVVNGTAAGVIVNAKAKLNITGTTKVKVPVTINAAAADTELISAVIADLQSYANATIELLQGAEESSVQIMSKTSTVLVKNNTAKVITVTDANNTKTQVAVKGSRTIKPTSTSTSSTGTGSWGGGSSWIGGGSGSSSGTTTSTSAVVRSQKDLTEALAKSRITTITIMDKDDKTGNDLEIAKANYPTKTLIVNAPKSTIRNHANFKDIQINDIAPNTWYEYAENNLTVAAPNPHIYIAKEAKVKGLTFGGAVKKAILDVKGEINSVIECRANDTNAKVTMNVEGKVQGLQIRSAMQVVVAVPTGIKAEPIPVIIAAPKAVLFSKAPVAVKVEVKEVTVILKESAENSTLEMAQKDLKPYVDSEVDVDVTVTNDPDIQTEIKKDTAAGEVTVSDDGKATVDTNAKPPVEVNDSTIDDDIKDKIPEETPSTGGDTTTSTGGGDTTTSTGGGDTTTSTVTAQVNVTSGTSLTITGDAITVNGQTEQVSTWGNAKFAGTENPTTGDKQYNESTGYEFNISEITDFSSLYVEFTVTTTSGTYTLKVQITLSEFKDGGSKKIDATVVSK